MNKKILFAALFFAALAFGFVGCENPDSESGISIEKPGDNSTSDKPTTPEAPILVATGDATEVGRSSVKLWGRINTDTLWAFPNIKWGIECSVSKEAIHSHSGNKTLCTTDLVGENTDEYSVAFTKLTGGKMLYYNAYLLINDIKYIYGEVDSVHLDVKLIASSNNTSYGTVTGSGTYDHLAEVTITATPKENYYYFTSWSDGNTDNPRTVTINEDITYTAIFEIIVSGTENGFGYIDLGLPSGLKWATCNVGATKPEEYGNYYAWGETTSKTTYDWSTYEWCNCNDYGWEETMTKYCTDSDYGTVDNKTTLDPRDDAATVRMHGSWRMPTAEEQKELIDECTWTWTTLNGVNGYNAEGPNGNAIFLPAAGYRSGPIVDGAGSRGLYWSSSLCTDYSKDAYSFKSMYWNGSERFFGFSVRGVCK